jgi:DNA mismatch repair protein MSH5
LAGIDDIFGSYVLNAQPSGDFSYEAAKNKLVNLELSAYEASNIIFTTPVDELAGDPYGHGDHGGMGRQGRLMRLAGRVDLDSRLTVCFGTSPMYGC